MKIKLYRHCETYQNKNNVEFMKEKEENILVTLVKKISDETGKIMPLDDLNNDGKYYFKVKCEENKIINYPIFRLSKDGIREQIQFLESKAILGEYFVSPKRGKK